MARSRTVAGTIVGACLSSRSRGCRPGTASPAAAQTRSDRDPCGGCHDHRRASWEGRVRCGIYRRLQREKCGCESEIQWATTPSAETTRAGQCPFSLSARRPTSSMKQLPESRPITFGLYIRTCTLSENEALLLRSIVEKGCFLFLIPFSTALPHTLVPCFGTVYPVNGPRRWSKSSTTSEDLAAQMTTTS